jgi:ParB-like chromosome segregation protein Spo0J
MASLREMGSKMWEAYGIDPRQIIIKKDFNPRDTSSPEAKKHIAWLKASIRERGVDEPIFIENTGKEIFLIDGECRLLACRQLWDEGVQVKVPTISFKGDEIAILKKSLIANNGLPLTVLELGKAAERLLALGQTVKEIAAYIAPHLGFTPKKAEKQVKDAVELQQAPMAVKEAVAHGVEVDGQNVSVSPALAVQEVRRSREKAPEAIKKAAVEAKAKGKKEAKRPKTAGKVTKAKVEAEKRTRTLEKIGDDMAREILRVPFDTDILETLAEEWKRARVLQ